MDVKDQIKNILDTLPQMSPVAMEVLQLVQDPDSDMTQIVEIAEYDPAITSNILRLANSAYFGGNGNIISIRDAIVRLGLRRIFHVAMAAAVNPLIEISVEGYGLRWGGLWRHSVAVGLGVEYLAFNLQLDVPASAFTSGLLHDVGKLVIPQLDGWDPERLRQLVKSKNISFEQAEKETFEFDHADIGAMLLESWNLPDEIVRVVRYHHRPDDLDRPDIVVDLVHIADLLSMQCGFGLGENDGLQYGFAEGVLQRIKLTELNKEIVRLQMLSGVEGICSSEGPEGAESSAGAPAGRRNS